MSNISSGTVWLLQGMFTTEIRRYNLNNQDPVQTPFFCRAERILQIGVCALNATRSYTRSKNMAALQMAINGPFNAANNKLEGCLENPECLPKRGRTGHWGWTAMKFRRNPSRLLCFVENKGVVRKQSCRRARECMWFGSWQRSLSSRFISPRRERPLLAGKFEK